MKLNFTCFHRKWQFALMTAAGFLPPALLLAQRQTPGNPWAMLWIAAAYAVLALATLVIPGRRRLPLGLLGAAALLALGFALLDWRASFLVLAGPVLYGVLLVLGLPVGGLTRDDSLPTLFPVGGLVMHVLAQITMFFNENTRGPSMQAVQPGLDVSFLVYGLMALICLNRDSLSTAAARGNPAPAGVRRRNMVMMLLTGLLTLVIACLPAVAAFLDRMVRALGRLLMRLIEWIGSLMASESVIEGAAPGGMPMFGAAGADEPGWFAVIAEKVMIVVVILMAAALLVFAVCKLWQKLRWLFGLLMQRLNRFASSASEDYIDEISDTREDGERSLLRYFRRKKAVDPLRGIDESTLAPGPRVRFQYLRLMLRHADWGPGSTARENLPVEAAEIYERVRYGGDGISPAESERFVTRTKTL